MQAVYGNVIFPNGVSVVTTRRQLLETPQKVPYGYTIAIDVETLIFGNTQAEIGSACQIVEDGLAEPYQNFVLYGDDGSPKMALNNATSLTGVRITAGPDYPNGTGGFEFVSGRTIRFTVEADYPLPNRGLIIKEWTETVSVEGGGPVKDFIPIVNGAPRRTVLFAQVPVRASQSGNAVGVNGYPTPPLPIWPDALLRAPRINRTSPPRAGRTYQDFAVSWAYVFGSVGPLNALPTFPPA